MDGRFICEVTGQLIVARLQGALAARVLEEGQAQIVSLVRSSRNASVLYDLRDLHFPLAQVLLHQQTIEHQVNSLPLRRAVVVSDVSVAYLARLAFSASDCRVFCGDYDAAAQYLSRGGQPTSAWSLAVSEDRRARERRSQVERQVAGRRRSAGDSTIK